MPQRELAVPALVAVADQPEVERLLHHRLDPLHRELLGLEPRLDRAEVVLD